MDALTISLLIVHRIVKRLSILTKMKTIQLVCLATLCSAIRAQSPLVRGGADKSFPTPSVDENIRKLNELHRNLQGIPCNVPYMTMTSEEIMATLIQVFSIKRDVFGVSDADTIIQDYIPMIEHDVQFMKVSQVVYAPKIANESNHSIFSNTFNFTIMGR